MQKKQAFTLIELLVVVLIIGILAAVAVPQYRKAVLKSQMMEALTIGRSVWDAQKVYFLANGVYAEDVGALDIDIPADFSEKYNFRMFGSHTGGGSGPRLNIAHETPHWEWDIKFLNESIMCFSDNSEPLVQQTCQSITGGEPVTWNNGNIPYTGYYLIAPINTNEEEEK